MARVQVVNIARVSLSPPGAACPKSVRLSFLDTIWLCLPPIRRLFLYPTDWPLSSVTRDLRASLSRILPHFYSLAGRFTHVPSSADVIISFSGHGDDGVDFLEAEAEGVDFQRLAEDEDHDVECFSSLVPALEDRKVFSVQVTGFAGAGVAVGFSLHHMAADGKALWQFVEAWAAECRRGAVFCGSAVAEPVLDRLVIRHPGAEEISRGFVRAMTSNPPQIFDPSASPPRQLSRKTFQLSAASIASLRDRGTSGTARPSAYVALSAHIWLTFLRAKGFSPDDQNVVVGFLADCRRHLNPPLGDGYFGNCVRPCIVQAKAKELLDGSGFTVACAAIKRVVDECQREPLADCEEWMEMCQGLPAGRVTNVVASPRFRVYEADFGWGRPTRVELVSMNHDGEVVLTAARDEEGAVQASVSLSPLHMEGFASLFLGGLERP